MEGDFSRTVLNFILLCSLHNSTVTLSPTLCLYRVSHDLAMLPELLCYPHGRLDGIAKPIPWAKGNFCYKNLNSMLLK